MKQIGTMRTKFVNTSHAPRKVHLRKVMRLAPEVVCAAPIDKLSLSILKSLASEFGSHRTHASITMILAQPPDIGAVPCDLP